MTTESALRALVDTVEDIADRFASDDNIRPGAFAMWAGTLAAEMWRIHGDAARALLAQPQPVPERCGWEYRDAYKRDVTCGAVREAPEHEHDAKCAPDHHPDQWCHPFKPSPAVAPAPKCAFPLCASADGADVHRPCPNGWCGNALCHPFQPSPTPPAPGQWGPVLCNLSGHPAHEHHHVEAAPTPPAPLTVDVEAAREALRKDVMRILDDRWNRTGAVMEAVDRHLLGRGPMTAALAAEAGR